MADRRMLTRKVTDDDRFTELSASAQALYLHLSMSADDDGFCNQVAVSMFKAHASVQDLQALLERRYLYQFDTGVIVIKHWRMANALRKDRYTPTTFREEFKKLQLKDNGAYTIPGDGNQVATNWQPDGNQTATQDRLGENRLGENRLTDGGIYTLKDREDLTAAAVKPDALAIYASNNLTYLSPGNMDELLSFRDSLSDDMIMYAIDAACGAGKRTYDYVRSILNRIVERGFRTLGEVKAAEEERRAKKDSAAASPIAQSIQRAKLAHRPMDERPVTDDEFEIDVMELMNRPRSAQA